LYFSFFLFHCLCFWWPWSFFGYDLMFCPFVVCHFSLLEPVMKITYPLLNDMPCCSFACAGLFEWPDWYELLRSSRLNNSSSRLFPLKKYDAIFWLLCPGSANCYRCRLAASTSDLWWNLRLLMCRYSSYPP
jgi:hypothetical protein